jgi:transposase
MELNAYFVDECHLHWGDTCGYVWGNRQDRVEVPIQNERTKQTYYGALNLLSKKVLLKGYDVGNTTNTINFIEELRGKNPGKRLLLIWDGASHHRSDEFKKYLTKVNEGCEAGEWAVTCIQFAPNAPEQNPIETVWLQGKKWLQEYWYLCRNFRITKWMFEWFVNENIFTFAKVVMYSPFF